MNKMIAAILMASTIASPALAKKDKPGGGGGGGHQAHVERQEQRGQGQQRAERQHFGVERQQRGGGHGRAFGPASFGPSAEQRQARSAERVRQRESRDFVRAQRAERPKFERARVARVDHPRKIKERAVQAAQRDERRLQKQDRKRFERAERNVLRADPPKAARLHGLARAEERHAVNAARFAAKRQQQFERMYLKQAAHRFAAPDRVRLARTYGAPIPYDGLYSPAQPVYDPVNYAYTPAYAYAPDYGNVPLGAYAVPAAYGYEPYGVGYPDYDGYAYAPVDYGSGFGDGLFGGGMGGILGSLLPIVLQQLGMGDFGGVGGLGGLGSVAGLGGYGDPMLGYGDQSAVYAPEYASADALGGDDGNLMGIVGSLLGGGLGTGESLLGGGLGGLGSLAGAQYADAGPVGYDGYGSEGSDPQSSIVEALLPALLG